MRHFHLDRIESIEVGVRAVGLRAVALSDDVFTEHFPGNPVLPGVYVLEGLAQTAGVLLWESAGRARLAVLVSVDRARFTSFARPGEVVRLAVDIDSQDERAARVRGVASVGERQIAVTGAERGRIAAPRRGEACDLCDVHRRQLALERPQRLLDLCPNRS